jgi:hypothetical protein
MRALHLFVSHAPTDDEKDKNRDHQNDQPLNTSKSHLNLASIRRSAAESADRDEPSHGLACLLVTSSKRSPVALVGFAQTRGFTGLGPDRATHSGASSAYQQKVSRILFLPNLRRQEKATPRRKNVTGFGAFCYLRLKNGWHNRVWL